MTALLNRAGVDIISLSYYFNGFCHKFLLQWEPVKYGNVEYPMWAHVIGFLMSASSMMWIPGYAIYYLYKTNGSLPEVKSFVYIETFFIFCVVEIAERGDSRYQVEQM